MLHMPSFSSSPYGMPEKKVESFAPAFTSVNGRSPTSPPKEQKLPFPVNTARSPVSRAPDNEYRSPDGSDSTSSSSHSESPTSPNKRRRADSEEDGYVKVSPDSATAPNYPPTQYHSGKLPSMETTQQRTLPPLERSEAERRWATEPRELSHSAFHELQPREARPTEPASSGPQGPILNASELNGHEQSINPEMIRPGMQGEPKRRKRQFANRTKTGCGTCRRRKKKCDEAKPECM